MSDTLHLDLALSFDGYALAAKTDIPLVGITALEGPSGSGKTTLLRIIAGLERRAQGVVRFGTRAWQSPQAFVPAQQRRIGFVFQDTRLFEHLNVAQNLAYGHKRAAAPKEVLTRVTEALDLRGLLQRHVGALSGGEQQRVAIGRALAMDPKMLLLDEPMSGLDQDRKDEILPYIARAVQALECPAIYVSHDRRETSMLADQIMRIEDGQVRGPVKCETTLPGVVHAGTDGRPALYVGEIATAMRTSGAVGSLWNIRINDAGLVLSENDPGSSTAMINLPATLVSIEQDHLTTCRLVLRGQGWHMAFDKPLVECDAMKLRAGQALWVSVSDATTTPIL